MEKGKEIVGLRAACNRTLAQQIWNSLFFPVPWWPEVCRLSPPQERKKKNYPFRFSCAGSPQNVEFRIMFIIFSRRSNLDVWVSSVLGLVSVLSMKCRKDWKEDSGNQEIPCHPLWIICRFICPCSDVFELTLSRSLLVGSLQWLSFVEISFLCRWVPPRIHLVPVISIYVIRLLR